MKSNDSINELCENYLKWTEMDKEQFSKIANELLQSNYYVKKKANENDYRFLKDNVSLFKIYFSMIDIEFEIDSYFGYAYIKSTSKYNKLNLDQTESKVLLALRYLYQNCCLKLTLADDVTISCSQLNDELKRTNSITENLKIRELRPILSTYKNYNIIDYRSQNDVLNDDAPITIYPSIKTVVDCADMRELDMKIKSYQKGDKNSEETHKNQTN
ncbi:MAG: DUF4194 domain-containing protein [Christensenellaceae bacterium]|jgi:hypothetical protein|nr:DUF4194 domain-containing protein [Christensenellaceae bacterium]